MADYRPYRNLPPLAGITDFEDAARPGLGVDECVNRLKRYHYVLKRLHGIYIARLTAEPIYELKMAFSYHAHLCAEHVTALRVRVGEMREPPLGLEDVPHPALAILCDEILAEPTTFGLLCGIYACLLPNLTYAIATHLDETNPLADHPTVRVLRFAIYELQEMLEWGRQALEALGDTGSEKVHDEALWIQCLDSAGGIDGSGEISDAPARRLSSDPFVYDPVPQRDERFSDPYNMGVNAEAFLYDQRFDARAKTLMMFYKRLREIDVPEMMASILQQTPDQPWEYHREMTRQLWDEARHAMMGEVGFVAEGLDWTRVAVNFTFALALNTQLEPLERHAVLYYIEQGLMPKTGKRFEWEVAVASANALAATFQDYDWADEVLHAQIGRTWYLSRFEKAREGLDYGDACWSKTFLNWEQYRDQGLTEHHNWWPELYRTACAAWDIEPDADALAFAESYRTARADLKAVE